MTTVDVSKEPEKKKGGFSREFVLIIVAWVLFFAAGVGLIIYASFLATEGHKLKMSKEAELFDSSVKAYLKSEVAQLDAWNVSVQIGSDAPVALNLTTKEIEVSEFGTRMSTYFNGTVANPPNNTNLEYHVSTPNSTFSVKRSVVYQETTKDCSSCETTAECKKKFDASATLKSNGKCNVLQQLNSNCVVVAEHRDDNGKDIWWRDFDHFGCTYPFKQAFDVPYVVNGTTDVTVRLLHDPYVQLGIHAGAHHGELEVEGIDKKPKSVGVYMCALLLLIGDVVLAIHVFKNKDSLLASSEECDAADEETKPITQEGDAEETKATNEPIE